MLYYMDVKENPNHPPLMTHCPPSPSLYAILSYLAWTLTAKSCCQMWSDQVRPDQLRPDLKLLSADLFFVLASTSDIETLGEDHIPPQFYNIVFVSSIARVRQAFNLA